MSEQRKKLAIDLFCGCGGLTVGLKQAGFVVCGAVDIEPLACKTYKANHPEINLWETDIQMLHPNEVFKSLNIKRGELDLLAGCPPCQGFSSMRTLNGAYCIDDPRNNLLFEFLRFVEALLPRAIMLENVPGLRDDERFDSFLRHMNDLGYLGYPHILNAADYGVPQRRRRLIYVAGLGMEIPLGKKADNIITVRQAIESLPASGCSGDPVHDIKERRTEKVKEIIRSIPKNGGSRTDLPIDMQLECHKRCTGFKDVYGRMAWDKVAPTITSGCFNPSKGRFLHPTEDRAITMREAALLQSFPLNYKFPEVTSKSAIALMIGNALPPEFIRRHASEIRKVLIKRKFSQ